MDNFKDSLRIGEDAEDRVFAYFSRRYIVDAARFKGGITAGRSTLAGKLQDAGIDALFTHRGEGDSFTVQVKADRWAHSTNNACIEMRDMDNGKPGWIHKCQAQILLYCVVSPTFASMPAMIDAYAVPVLAVRDKLPRWVQEYGNRRDYGFIYPKTQGVTGERFRNKSLLVPLDALTSLARGVHKIDGDDADYYNDEQDGPGELLRDAA